MSINVAPADQKGKHMKDSEDSIFGQCMYGMVKMKGTWTGWIQPCIELVPSAEAAVSRFWESSYLVTRPCVDRNLCQAQLELLASMAKITLSKGTWVGDKSPRRGHAK